VGSWGDENAFVQELPGEVTLLPESVLAAELEEAAPFFFSILSVSFFIPIDAPGTITSLTSGFNKSAQLVSA
jgi:hypothetical protein